MHYKPSILLNPYDGRKSHRTSIKPNKSRVFIGNESSRRKEIRGSGGTPTPPPHSDRPHRPTPQPTSLLPLLSLPLLSSVYYEAARTSPLPPVGETLTLHSTPGRPLVHRRVRCSSPPPPPPAKWRRSSRRASSSALPLWRRSGLLASSAKIRQT